MNLGSVAWYSVMLERSQSKSDVLMDGRHTLRAALALAERACETYGQRVSVFRGKRVGRFVRAFEPAVPSAEYAARNAYAEACTASAPSPYVEGSAALRACVEGA